MVGTPGWRATRGGLGPGAAGLTRRGGAVPALRPLALAFLRAPASVLASLALHLARAALPT